MRGEREILLHSTIYFVKILFFRQVKIPKKMALTDWLPIGIYLLWLRKYEQKSADL